MGMRPRTERLSAAGQSPWIPLNYRASHFGCGLGVVLSSGANLTCKVEHTFDSVHEKVADFSLSRVTTTATVNKTNHGMSVNDSVIIEGAGAPFDGTFQVASVVDANNFTYTVANSGATAVARGVARGAFLRVFDHDTLTGLTADADGNYEFPPVACRLNVTAYTGGFVDLIIISAGE